MTNIAAITLLATYRGAHDDGGTVLPDVVVTLLLLCGLCVGWC